jgi:hypothetical protein
MVDEEETSEKQEEALEHTAHEIERWIREECQREGFRYEDAAETIASWLLRQAERARAVGAM